MHSCSIITCKCDMIPIGRASAEAAELGLVMSSCSVAEERAGSVGSQSGVLRRRAEQRRVEGACWYGTYYIQYYCNAACWHQKAAPVLPDALTQSTGQRHYRPAVSGPSSYTDEQLAPLQGKRYSVYAGPASRQCTAQASGPGTQAAQTWQVAQRNRQWRHVRAHC